METLIDTADPDVANVFLGVRLLNSSDQNLRRQGERMLSQLSSSYPALSKFSQKIAAAVHARHMLHETRAKDQTNTKRNEDSKPDKRKPIRLTISLSDGAFEALRTLQEKKN